MNRNALIVRALFAMLVVILGVWLVSATEWVDVYMDAQPQGEALTNELYATQTVARALGATVVKREGLDVLPPQHATMVLRSLRWTLRGEQDEHLRHWVEQGGHLLIPAYMLRDKQLGDWLSIELKKEENDDEPNPARAAGGAKATHTTGPETDAAPNRVVSQWESGQLVNGSACHDVLEMAVNKPDPAQLSETGRKWRLCSFTSYVLHSASTPVWGLEGPNGPEALRVAVGRGTVTVLGPDDTALKRNVLSSDNAQVLVAALGLQLMSEIWFVTDEKPRSFLLWLWVHAWQAVVLSGLALVAALWRAGARFGPQVADAGVGRRSVAEQVRGTAQFLRNQSGDALHLAQARALDEMAARYIPQYRSMDAAARAQAIAQRSAADSTALARAMNRTLRRTPHDLQAALQLLEAARRAVQAAGMQARPGPETS